MRFQGVFKACSNRFQDTIKACTMMVKLQVTKRQLDTFDRLYGMGGPASPTIPRNSILEKDFECPVCYEVKASQSENSNFKFQL